MAEVKCPSCGLIWKGYGGKGLLRKHECLGTATPTVDDLLAYLEVGQDDHGCLIPASPFARPARGGGQHWWLPRAAIRIIGEQYAHRAVLRLRLGRPLGVGLVAAHECAPPHYENPQCVNPQHLHERTRRENSLWMSPERRSEVLGGPLKRERFVAGNTDPAVRVKQWETRRERYGKSGKRHSEETDATAGGKILTERWQKE